VNDTPASLASLGDQYVCYAMRQHLAAAHRLPPGLSYLVPRDGLPGFHAEAHARPGRFAAWRRLRRLRKARLVR
jgi:hypothetical protein